MRESSGEEVKWDEGGEERGPGKRRRNGEKSSPPECERPTAHAVIPSGLLARCVCVCVCVSERVE